MDPSIFTIKDLLVSFGAGIGTIIAIIGLRTWRKQIAGKAEYETARRLLKNVYKLREAIAMVRNPFMFPEEMVDKSSNNNQQSGNHNEGVKVAYKNRWEKVIEANSEASADLLEAEVLWGNDIREKYKQIAKIVGELFSVIKLYIISLEPNSGLKFKQDDGKILYSMGDDDKDEFFKKLQKSIKGIEDILKPHLNRRD